MISQFYLFQPIEPGYRLNPLLGLPWEEKSIFRWSIHQTYGRWNCAIDRYLPERHHRCHQSAPVVALCLHPTFYREIKLLRLIYIWKNATHHSRFLIFPEFLWEMFAPWYNLPVPAYLRDRGLICRQHLRDGIRSYHHDLNKQSHVYPLDELVSTFLWFPTLIHEKYAFQINW